MDLYYCESARLALRVVQSSFSSCSQPPVHFLYKWKEKDSSLAQWWSLPHLSLLALAVPGPGTHIKAELWAGRPGRTSLPSLLCSADSPPRLLTPGLCVWSSWGRASADDSLSGQRHGVPALFALLGSGQGVGCVGLGSGVLGR